jgi:hypothetical protein
LEAAGARRASSFRKLRSTAEMNHKGLRSTGKIVVSYGRGAVVFNKSIRVDVPVNPLLLDCDQPSFRINCFRNIKGRRPSVVF